MATMTCLNAIRLSRKITAGLLPNLRVLLDEIEEEKLIAQLAGDCGALMQKYDASISSMQNAIEEFDELATRLRSNATFQTVAIDVER